MSAPAAAQERPGSDPWTRVYLTTAAADVVTTGYLFAAHRYAYEGNPMYGWVMDKDEIAAGRRATVGQVSAVLAMSTAVDLATVWAVRKWVAPEHPRVARVLLFIGAGVRGRQAFLNISRSRER